MVLGREKSVVRFKRGSSPKNKKALVPKRQKSDLRNIHRYIPRLHRQQTEQAPDSLLGRALKTVAELCSDHQELFFSPIRSAARQELQDIIDRSFMALSRNALGIQFREPVHLFGFAHWQAYPEKRVICFLPIQFQKLKFQPGESGSVFINLPRHFQSYLSLNPGDLKNPRVTGRYLSRQRLFSLVLAILMRILKLKSVSQERIRCSEMSGVLEVDLVDNPGWIGEIVFCLSLDKSDTMYYCSKPFYHLSMHFPNVENNDSNKEDPVVDDFEKTPRSVVSVDSNIQSISKLSISTKAKVVAQSTEDAKSGSSSHAKHVRASTANDTCVDETSSACVSTATEAEVCPTDEDFDDITWYACQPKGENNLIRSISVTDNGMRLTALLIVFRLLQHDWRLLPFSCYHVQAAMLHGAELALDSSPRWQRNSLESCVRLLLSTLNHFITIECLPHFSITHLNLWIYLSRKQLALAKSAMGRLVQSDTALLSLVRRTGRFGTGVIEETEVSDIFQPDIPSRQKLLKPITF